MVKMLSLETDLEAGERTRLEELIGQMCEATQKSTTEAR